MFTRFLFITFLFFSFSYLEAIKASPEERRDAIERYLQSLYPQGVINSDSSQFVDMLLKNLNDEEEEIVYRIGEHLQYHYACEQLYQSYKNKMPQEKWSSIIPLVSYSLKYRSFASSMKVDQNCNAWELPLLILHEYDSNIPSIIDDKFTLGNLHHTGIQSIDDLESQISDYENKIRNNIRITRDLPKILNLKKDNSVEDAFSEKMQQIPMVLNNKLYTNYKDKGLLGARPIVTTSKAAYIAG